MDYVKFGKTGLGVSRLCIGCMTYGIPNRGTHQWTLDEEKSRPLIKQALDLGINFFDTANVYSDGTSEEIVGRALKDFVRREDVVIATKVNSRMRPGPNGAGLSRKAILAKSTTACAASEPILSTSIRSIAPIRPCRSRKPWKRCMTW